MMIDDFLKDIWRGTATELCSELSKQIAENNLTPLSVTKLLKQNIERLKSKYNIKVSFERSSTNRLVILERDN